MSTTRPTGSPRRCGSRHRDGASREASDERPARHRGTVAAGAVRQLWPRRTLGAQQQPRADSRRAKPSGVTTADARRSGRRAWAARGWRAFAASPMRSVARQVAHGDATFGKGNFHGRRRHGIEYGRGAHGMLSGVDEDPAALPGCPSAWNDAARRPGPPHAPHAPGDPFLALRTSGSATADTGWAPRFVSPGARGELLVAARPRPI